VKPSDGWNFDFARARNRCSLGGADCSDWSLDARLNCTRRDTYAGVVSESAQWYRLLQHINPIRIRSSDTQSPCLCFVRSVYEHRYDHDRMVLNISGCSKLRIYPQAGLFCHHRRPNEHHLDLRMSTHSFYWSWL